MLNVNEVSRLYLGIQGENGARPIEIDVKPWLVAHPQGSVSIWHKRNGDLVPSPTGAVFDDDEGTVTWTPSSTDTYVSGEGVAEIRLTEGNVIKKTRAVITGVSPSPTGAGVPLGSDWASYIAEVDRIKGLAVVAKQEAEQSAEDAEAWAVGQRGGVDVESDDPTYENNAKHYSEVAAEEAEAAAEDAERILGMDVTVNTLGENEDATSDYNHDTGLMTLGIPRGKSAKITSETVQYQQSASGTVVPTGTWLNERPNLVQGEFLWIKRTRVWNNSGETRVSYEAYYTPMDGDSPQLAFDDRPTEGSMKIPRSGGTWSMIKKIAEALDDAKVDKVTGKGLSTNDYTTAEKEKLEGIAAGAQVNPGNATQSAAGLMSSTDKTKLDGIDSGATANVVSDSLQDTSTTNALSAAKGKALKDGLDDAEEDIDQKLLTPSAAFAIPAAGNSVSYDMDGLTADHELIRWNFSSSAENSPPASLSWATYAGYFAITNTAGTTDETIKPVFGIPVGKTITIHTF